MINRSYLSDDEAEALDYWRSASLARRARNTAAGLCLNDTDPPTHKPRTHGVLCLNDTDPPTHKPRTHGVLCLDCREHHRGHTYESELGRDGYLALRKQAQREGRRLRDVANDFEREQR